MRRNNPPIKIEDSFYSIRRAIFMNFISANAPIKEEDLTPEDCLDIIREVGEDYIRRNKRGITKIKNICATEEEYFSHND